MNAIACAYVLAKNEINNIDACLQALTRLSIPVVVLDSGSTDGTLLAVAAYANVTCRAYDYRGHCTAYNDITAQHSSNELVLILDADMRIDPKLHSEIEHAFDNNEALQVGIAPISMCWDGLPLKHASLCPPKWIAFRGGFRYFKPVGHGETLVEGITQQQLLTALVHDDRKPYAHTLANQWRYALELSRRSRAGNLTWRDRLRIRTPLMLFITPFYSLFFKLGILDGKAGLLYALDRFIYEALAYRAALSPLVQAELQGRPLPPVAGGRLGRGHPESPQSDAIKMPPP